MKIGKIISASLAVMLGWCGTAFAQSEVDALRYTRFGVTGSARIQGIGGAQTALGADISTIASNPAGLGMFRRSEFSITPGFGSFRADASANGNSTTDERNSITIPHAGLVIANRKGDNEDGDWRGVNFGISFTGLNNFNQQVSYRNTVEPPNTIVDYFADLAFGRSEADMDGEFGNFNTLSGLAYGTYLLNFNDEFGRRTSAAQPLYSLGTIDQREDIQRRGSQNQIDFGLGTSFRDKIYLGASLGIMSTNFTQESIFRESGYYVVQFDEETGQALLDGDYALELRDEFRTRGAGVNLKVGVIVRPVDALRIGLTLQSPTAFTFNDTYQRSLYTTTVNPGTGVSENNSAAEMPGEFSYSLTTPFRATGGVAYFIGKYGFVSADLEFVDYSNTRFSAAQGGGTSTFFTDLNNRVSNTYRSVVNYRIGAEGRYEIFRFRAGYSMSTDPYNNSAFGEGQISSFSLGTGVRLQNYYVDLAYVNSNFNNRYSPYIFSDNTGPVIDIDNRMNSVVFTLGYNF